MMRIKIDQDSFMDYFSSNNLQASLEKDPEQSIEHIALKMDKDQPKGSRSLIISIVKLKDEKESLNYIQFCSVFPFKVKKEQYLDLAMLLNLWNLSLSLPGFYLDLNQGGVFYRYVLHIQEDSVGKKTLDSILEMIPTILDFYVHIIEEISLGNITVKDLLQNIYDLQKKELKTQVSTYFPLSNKKTP